MEKSISELKVEFVCMCVWEKKQQQFLRCIKKDFKFAELVAKTSFSFSLENVP